MAIDPYGYPAAGYSFELTLFKEGAPWFEIKCKSVTGIEMSLKYASDGATPPNPLPPLAQGMSYSDLVVTKGVVAKGNADDKSLFQYMEKQASNTGTPFLDLTLVLLNEEGSALRGWSFTRVVISKWKVSGLDAEKSGYAVDEITFKYRQFTLIDWN